MDLGFSGLGEDRRTHQFFGRCDLLTQRSLLHLIQLQFLAQTYRIHRYMLAIAATNSIRTTYFGALRLPAQATLLQAHPNRSLRHRDRISTALFEELKSAALVIDWFHHGTGEAAQNNYSSDCIQERLSAVDTNHRERSIFETVSQAIQRIRDLPQKRKPAHGARKTRKIARAQISSLLTTGI